MVAPPTPAIDDRLMITPPPWAIIWRPAHLQPKNTPFRLMPTTVFQPFGVMSSGAARKEAPALLTITSSRPMSRTVPSASSLTASCCRTSRAIANERRPSFWISALTGSRFSIFRLATTTSAPARANSTAIDRPMPTPPPVTMAIFFSRENGERAMGSPWTCSGPNRWRNERAMAGHPRSGLGRARGLYPAGRWRALEGDRLPGTRMNRAEAARVQGEAAERIAAAPVRAVASDRMARIRELDADLMAPARSERQLEQGGVAPPPEDP